MSSDELSRAMCLRSALVMNRFPSLRMRVSVTLIVRWKAVATRTGQSLSAHPMVPKQT